MWQKDVERLKSLHVLQIRGLRTIYRNALVQEEASGVESGVTDGVIRFKSCTTKEFIMLHIFSDIGDSKLRRTKVQLRATARVYERMCHVDPSWCGLTYQTA